MEATRRDDPSAFQERPKSSEKRGVRACPAGEFRKKNLAQTREKWGEDGPIPLEGIAVHTSTEGGEGGYSHRQRGERDSEASL